MNCMQFESIEQIRSMVATFELGCLPKSEWDHGAHLTVAAWYMWHYPSRIARRRIVSGIKRYNAANGIVETPTGGYHETLTVFWSSVVEVAVAECTRDNLVDSVNGVITDYWASKNLVFQFYDREELFSPVARRSWVPPQRYPGGEWARLSRALASRWMKPFVGRGG
jgi:hypothetical protein